MIGLLDLGIAYFWNRFFPYFLWLYKGKNGYFWEVLGRGFYPLSPLSKPHKGGIALFLLLALAGLDKGEALNAFF